MADGRWMLYGANGYTGTLLAEEARRRGHRPVLAGRSASGVGALAERLGLEWKAFSLDDPSEVSRSIAGFDVVLHAAGPFAFTAAPMRRACLDVGASYVDVTGEIAVFQASFALDREAQERGVALISGAGFDVVPTDCLAKHVADQVPDAQVLEIAFAAIGAPSGGTLKSAIEAMPGGGFIRRGGRLVKSPAASVIRRVRFSDRERTVMSIPWGDLETAYHSTGIGDITTFIAQPERAAKLVRAAGPLLGVALGSARVRKLVQSAVGRWVHGPSEQEREASRSYVWACASAADGRRAEAWLETLDGYAFTAASGVRIVERILAERPRGALTPSMAFGADFVLEIDETRRYDALPG